MCKSSRLQKSYDRIVQAVTELIDATDDINRITVTDIVRAAGLTRPTFYACFRDIPSAFASSARERLDRAFDGFDLSTHTGEADYSARMSAAFKSILDRLERNAGYFTKVLNGPGCQMAYEQIVFFVSDRLRNHSPVSVAFSNGVLPPEVSCSAIAAGVTWMTTQWLIQARPISTQDLAKQISIFISYASRNGLGTKIDDIGRRRTA